MAKARRNYVFAEAVNPQDGKLWHLLLSHQKMDDTAKRGMLHAKELAHTVPTILRAPRAIFKGIRDENDEGLCYVGVPSCSFRGAEGHRAPPWEKEVFLVFVNPEGIIYNWRWEKRALDNPFLPVDYRTRFRERAL